MSYSTEKFKKQLRNDIIPRVEIVIKKEEEHLAWLRYNKSKSPLCHIYIRKYEIILEHLNQRLLEYKHYASI